MLRRLPSRTRRVGFSAGDAAEDLRRLPGDERLEVILSNHLVRYALLPWSPALKAQGEWLAFARHVFEGTYGTQAADWRIRVSDCGRGKARVACAVDGALLDALGAVERVVSIQPHLMSAFNGRRSEFDAKPGWFVVQETGRLTLGFIADGEWKLLRHRQAGERWRDLLDELLHRECAAGGLAHCRRVVLSEGLATGLPS